VHKSTVCHVLLFFVHFAQLADYAYSAKNFHSHYNLHTLLLKFWITHSVISTLLPECLTWLTA